MANTRGHSGAFMLKLLRAWIAMGFRRPAVEGVPSGSVRPASCRLSIPRDGAFAPPRDEAVVCGSIETLMVRSRVT
jgi:hypothetical protein